MKATSGKKHITTIPCIRPLWHRMIHWQVFGQQRWISDFVTTVQVVDRGASWREVPIDEDHAGQWIVDSGVVTINAVAKHPPLDRTHSVITLLEYSSFSF